MKTTLNITLHDSLIENLKDKAHSNNRTLDAQIEYCLLAGQLVEQSPHLAFSFFSHDTADQYLSEVRSKYNMLNNLIED